MKDEVSGFRFTPISLRLLTPTICQQQQHCQTIRNIISTFQKKVVELLAGKVEKNSPANKQNGLYLLKIKWFDNNW